MHVEHFEKGLRYSDKELLVLARKIGKMATYCKTLKDEASVIRVEAARSPTKKKQDEVVVTITVELPRARLQATSRKHAALEAVDRAVEKIEPQLLRYKEKHTGRDRAHRATRVKKGRSGKKADIFDLAA
jgi:ribosomal subunit interface protein